MLHVTVVCMLRVANKLILRNYLNVDIHWHFSRQKISVRIFECFVSFGKFYSKLV